MRRDDLLSVPRRAGLRRVVRALAVAAITVIGFVLALFAVVRLTVD